jgi:hypothetical protein
MSRFEYTGCRQHENKDFDYRNNPEGEVLLPEQYWDNPEIANGGNACEKGDADEIEKIIVAHPPEP